MKFHYTVALAFAAIVFACAPVQADPGLLVIAHGSPSAKSNALIVDMTKRMQATGKTAAFKQVKTAYMENGMPDIATAAEELQAAGCTSIVALPVFIASTSHTHFDVPAVLGLYSSEKTTHMLEEEGIRRAKLNIPVTLTGTMAQSDLLTNFVLAETAKMSKKSEDEALVILLHGDKLHGGMIEDMCRQMAVEVAAKTGVSYVDWASIKVGQGFADAGKAAIREALEHRKRVLVVGLYIGISAKNTAMRARGASVKDGLDTTGTLIGKEFPWSDDEVIFSMASVGETDAAAEWMAENSAAALRH